MNGIIGWWPLDGHTQDYSGNNNHGTNNGATITSGIRGNAYEFSEDVSYIDIPNQPGDTLDFTDKITMSAWVYRYSVNNCYIISKNQSAGFVDMQYALYLGDRSANYRDIIAVVGGSDVRFNHSENFAVDKWTHIVASFDGSIMRIYVDGEFLGEGALSPNSTYRPNFRIGNRNGQNSIFDGRIQDVRIYNRPLSPQEIKSLYNATKPNAIPMQLSNDGTVYLAGELKEA